MAKRKRTTRRRRRIGAAGLNLNSPVIKLAAVAGAYFLAADPVNTAIDTQAAKVFKKPAGADGVVPAGVSDMGNYVILGAEAIGAYMLMMKGRSSLVKTIAGAVLAGSAVKRGLKKFGVISGYQQVPVIAGYQQVPVIGSRRSMAGYGVNGVGGYGVNGRSQSVMGSAMDRGVTSGSDLLGG